MALSRLRLRIALAFTIAFAAGLALLAAVAFGFLYRESHRRLDARLDHLINDVRVNLTLELQETPDSTSGYVAAEVVGEWPRNGGSFLVCSGPDLPTISTDTAAYVAKLANRCGDTSTSGFDTQVNPDQQLRVAIRQLQVSARRERGASVARTFKIVAFASTSGISEDSELLFTAIGIATPVILIFSLTGGYLMARRALRPVTDLRVAISNIAPNDLKKRLDVAEPQDELGAVANEFNELLRRLSSAQEQNRKFLREAAHQIRTPLTLVLGEAAYELEAKESSGERMRDSLKRIALASERMRRRVDELFLLAEAQSGEPVSLKESIELDGLVLDAVDLMRPRSTALGRALAIGNADHIVVQGNTALLQEALLELTENALRHGDASQPVTVSVFANGSSSILEVASGGRPFELPVRTRDTGPQGLGLPIVRWIAEVHGGKISVSRDRNCNAVRVELPHRATSATS